jgi:Protein of unknown function (DUF1176)
MSLSFVRAAFVGSLLAAPLHATSMESAPIELGKQIFQKDWAAACDNTLSCQAISLMPEGDGERAPAIMISRDSSSEGAVAVKISLVEPMGDQYRILVDGRLANSGMLSKGEWPVQVAGKDALKLARAIGRGNKLVVQGADGKPLGELMLSGSAAALKHIDVTQNRARTRSALFALGRRALRPKSTPLPVITARRIGKQETLPDAGAIVSVVENSSCATERTTVTEDTVYSLGRQDGSYRALAIVSCGSGAYNMSVAPFVGTSADGKQWTFAPARFDYQGKPGEGPVGPKLLVNASWDGEKQQLSSYYKGRGLGDCGSAETYVWDGAMFRLVSAYAMDECRGSTEWMPVWRAKVELKD